MFGGRKRCQSPRRDDGHLREECLVELLGQSGPDPEGFVAAFLHPPLHSTEYGRGMGTLYTVAYHVQAGRAEYRWPGIRWEQSFERFDEGERSVAFAQASAA